MARPELTATSVMAVDRLRTDPAVTTPDVDRLLGIVRTSSRLVALLNTVTSEGEIRGFTVQPDDVHAGGTYWPDSRTLALPLRVLRERGPATDADVAFVVGHEVQHARNRSRTTVARRELRQRAREEAARHGDYSEVVDSYIASARWDEDRSNIEGWNVFVEHCAARALPMDEALSNVERARRIAVFDLRSGITPRPGFFLNDDMTLEPTTENIAAMTTHYTGMAPGMVRLGRHASSDYPNYYGADAISIVAYEHRSAWLRVAQECIAHGTPVPAERPVPLRLGTHGLKPQLLEENGLHLGYADDLAYLDLSTFPPTRGVFHHTSDERAPTRASLAAPIGREATVAREEHAGTREASRGADARSRNAQRTAAAESRAGSERTTARGTRPGRPGQGPRRVDRRPGRGVER